MARRSRKFSILIVSDGQSAPINFSVNATLFYTFLILIGASALAFLIGIFFYGRILSRATQADFLAQENRRLRAENEQVHAIEDRLKQMEELSTALVKMAGIPIGLRKDENNKVVIDTLGSLATSPESLQQRAAATPLNLELTRMTRDLDLGQVPSGMPVTGVMTAGWGTQGMLFSSPHSGVDFAVSDRTPVKATARGLVTFAGTDPDYGRLVVIDHLNGYQTRYGHNSAILVDANAFVGRGDIIALSGHSGKASGPHLHYEVLYQGKSIDPRSFLDPHYKEAMVRTP